MNDERNHPSGHAYLWVRSNVLAWWRSSSP